MDAVFEGRQLFDTDGAARVDRPVECRSRRRAEFAAVRILGGRVMQDDGGVDFGEEWRRPSIGRHDRVGVMRTVAVDMGDAASKSTTFAAMILSRYSAGQSSSVAASRAVGFLRGGVAADLAPGLDTLATSGPRMCRRGVAIDEQRLGGPAYARPAQLRVQDNLFAMRVRGAVDIDVARAFEMREHGYAGLLLDAGDEALAAARHDQSMRRPGRRASSRPRRVRAVGRLDRRLRETGSAKPSTSAAWIARRNGSRPNRRAGSRRYRP